MPVKVSVKVSAKKRGTKKYKLDERYLDMTRQELAKYCKRYYDMANKRIRRLESQGMFSPALHSVKFRVINGHSGEFHVKGCNLNELRSEINRCINFLNMETSTVTGAKRHERTLEARFNQGKKFTQEQHRAIFNIYRSAQKVNPYEVKVYGSDRLIQYIANEISSADDAIMHDNGILDFDALLERVKREVEGTVDYMQEKAFSEFENVLDLH